MVPADYERAGLGARAPVAIRSLWICLLDDTTDTSAIDQSISFDLSVSSGVMVR